MLFQGRLNICDSGGDRWRDLPAGHPRHSRAGGVQGHERSVHEVSSELLQQSASKFVSLSCEMNRLLTEVFQDGGRLPDSVCSEQRKVL